MVEKAPVPCHLRLQENVNEAALQMVNVIDMTFPQQLINAVVLLILLSALNDPVQYHYHLTSTELGTDFDVMDDASEFGSLNVQIVSLNINLIISIKPLGVTLVPVKCIRFLIWYWQALSGEIKVLFHHRYAGCACVKI